MLRAGYLGLMASIALGQGLDPRNSASAYAASGRAGEVRIGAEYRGRVIPWGDSPVVTAEFLVVETNLFGSTELKVSPSHFRIRIDGKLAEKAQPAWVVVNNMSGRSVPMDAKELPSSSVYVLRSTLPRVTPPPSGLRPTDIVSAAALPSGKVDLPAAGVLYFRYGGEHESIASLELIYDGPAGKASIKLR